MDLDTHRIAPVSPSDRLLVVLHGRGDSHRGFTWLPDALRLDGLGYLLVDAPDPYYDGFSWYDLPPHQAPGVVRSRRLLDRLFTDLAAGGQDPARTALLGFSQGCLMALEWGGRSEVALAAYVGISGYLLDASALQHELHPQARRPDWLVTHGRSDEVLPFDTTAAQVRGLQAGGWPLRFEAFDKGHTIVPEEVDVVRAFLAHRLAL
jgi:phospholipase/carboxylesterase